MSDVATSFSQAHSWHPEPAAEAAEPSRADPVSMALLLLAKIAENPYVCGSQRTAARRFLHALERQAAEAAAARLERAAR